MKLRHVLKALIFSLIGMHSIVFAEEKPNIVIILTDDQGYADVSYNPHSPPEVSTPNIDALAHSSDHLHSGLYQWTRVFADSRRTHDRSLSATIWNLYGRGRRLRRSA